MGHDLDIVLRVSLLFNKTIEVASGSMGAATPIEMTLPCFSADRTGRMPVVSYVVDERVFIFVTFCSTVDRVCLCFVEFGTGRKEYGDLTLVTWSAL